MKRDFTTAVKNGLQVEIKDISGVIQPFPMNYGDVEKMIGTEVSLRWKTLNLYSEDLTTKNEVALNKVEQIWSAIEQLDYVYNSRFSALNEVASAYYEKLQLIRKKLQPDAVINTLTGAPQNLKNEMSAVTNRIELQRVNYGYEKLVVRDAENNIVDYNWQLIKRYMEQDAASIPAYQYYSFVKLLDELDCTVDADRKIMEQFIETGYIKSRFIKEAGIMLHLIPTDKYTISDTFCVIIEKYVSRERKSLNEYQILNCNILSFLNTFGSYFMVEEGEKFHVNISQGINSEGRDINVKADLKYDFTIEFPGAKITEDVSAINWCETEDARGLIFQVRDGNSADNILGELSISELRGMKRDKNKELIETIFGNTGNSIVGAGLSTGQGFVLDGALALTDIMNINTEIDTYNGQLDQMIEQIQIGLALDALGADSVGVQLYENERLVHIDVSLLGEETYGRLYVYYLDNEAVSSEKAAQMAKDAMAEWTEGGKVDITNEDLQEYKNWYYMDDGEEKYMVKKEAGEIKF